MLAVDPEQTLAFRVAGHNLHRTALMPED